ncbi:hypothetical protein GlitD10_0681 [Gloeomargarita lithophora Alchichica-D10]|uniref:Uncharacterized protein n=1 Tax=Gloeomargarita lithophora Alchichica-D10 TaxID=1188229 RepID=A0A1J0AAN7_9CYAN|nr:hypothetical protein [Gloeomargarita lithophora]APB32995.1 hypothetical protein GlitD10_0681 [Gloeomargarita lithophora Alchichica-D10]
MAKDQSRRLRPALLQTDQEVLAALLAFPDYTPSNPEYRREALQAAWQTMQGKQSLEVQALAAAKAARDEANGSEWRFHNLMLAAKEQVIAQYGRDSAQVQALGLRRKSEYRGRTRRTAAGG